MVLDSLENLDAYVNLHPSFRKVFDYIKGLNLEELPTGKTVVDDDFYLSVSETELKNVALTTLEAHNKYIDIQIPITSFEYVGYKPRKTCKYIKEIHAKEDYMLYKDKFDFSFALPVGSFVIFYPQDAHAPLIGKGTTKKLVVKVKI